LTGETGPELAGNRFRTGWDSATLDELFGKILKTMPREPPTFRRPRLLMLSRISYPRTISRREKEWPDAGRSRREKPKIQAPLDPEVQANKGQKAEVKDSLLTDCCSGHFAPAITDDVISRA
jgi:hypothetical protein